MNVTVLYNKLSFFCSPAYLANVRVCRTLQEEQGKKRDYISGFKTTKRTDRTKEIKKNYFLTDPRQLRFCTKR